MKIDYVIPMVFDNDLQWRDAFRHARWRSYTRQDREAARWRSMGTEELLVRCIRQFMPFIGTIHILLARESQRQLWMDDYGINVVLHRDFIPPLFLPTFNSRTIEMFLHRIPGLSEQFIYSNDDIFPVSPMKETDFFVDGKPCQHIEHKELPEDYSQFGWVCKEGMKLVARGFGIDEPDNVWLSTGHGVTPLLKSTFTEVWARHGDEIQASITVEREWKNYNQYIFAYFQHYSGMYVEKENDAVYTDNLESLDDVRKAIGGAKGIVCVNDAIKTDGFDDFAATVSAAIEQRLQNCKEKTYGKRTESNTTGAGSADDATVSGEQRRDGGDDTLHAKEVQDQMAEKRPADKAYPASAPQDKRGKGKNNGKRSFRFNS